eukprot:1156326-Pelagomonas_calceolata.AAC.9
MSAAYHTGSGAAPAAARMQAWDAAAGGGSGPLPTARASDACAPCQQLAAGRKCSWTRILHWPMQMPMGPGWTVGGGGPGCSRAGCPQVESAPALVPTKHAAYNDQTS